MERTVALSLRKKKTLADWLKSYTGQKYTTTALFLLVPVLLLVVFTFIPAWDMILFSFQNRDQFGLNAEWVGLDNYITVFTRKDYYITFLNCGYYLVGSFVQLSIALLVASVLCSPLKAKNIFKGILFFPYLMNGVAVSLIFRRFFQKGDGITNTEGTLNSIIELLGGSPISWLSNPSIVNFCLVFASIWRYIGFDILMFIGAIQSVNSDYYEAAQLDGANAWHRFAYIVFPSIKPIVGLQMILAIKGAISVFETPYIITEGNFGTSTFVIKTIETAFEYKKVGLGSAMAMVLLLIIILVTILQRVFLKTEKNS